MEEKETKKKSYEEPTLVEREKIIDITEGGPPVVGSTVVAESG